MNRQQAWIPQSDLSHPQAGGYGPIPEEVTISII